MWGRALHRVPLPNYGCLIEEDRGQLPVFTGANVTNSGKILND